MLLAVAVLGPRQLIAQRNCVKGKPCGNTCIAQNRVCRIGSGSATTTPKQETGGGAESATPRSLLGTGTATPTGSSSVGVLGPISCCTTSTESIRDLYLVAGPRPSGTIGRDVSDGSPFYAPGSHDTVPATLISIHWPQADQAQLLITVNGRRVMLDARSIPLRTMQGESSLLGNLLVRQQGRYGRAFVWVDALGVGMVGGQ